MIITISDDTIYQIKDNIGRLLSDYSAEISVAIVNEGMVTISLPVKIVQNGPKLNIDIGINFIKERIKNATSFVVDGQKELFDQETGECRE